MTRQFRELYGLLSQAKDSLPSGAFSLPLRQKIQNCLEENKTLADNTKYTIGESGVTGYGNGFIGVYIVAQSSEFGDKEDECLSTALYKARKDIENAISEWELKYNDEFKSRIAKEKVELLILFPGTIFHEEIPNEYSDIPYYKAQPWLSVTTTAGIFKIGRRKRVISLDWSRTLCKKTAEVLFEDQNTTKGDYYIHAWSLEDAKKYINTIISNV